MTRTLNLFNSASVPSPRARIQLSVTTAADATVAVVYDDPGGETRTVSHAAIAAAELTLHRPGERELTLSATSCAYEYGTRGERPGTEPEPVPRG